MSVSVSVCMSGNLNLEVSVRVWHCVNVRDPVSVCVMCVIYWFVCVCVCVLVCWCVGVLVC